MTISKSDLRAQSRLRRRELAASHPHAAEQAAGRLPLAAVGVVAGYYPIGSELDPWPTLLRLQAAGARIALPVAVGLHEPLRFRAYAPGDALEPDASRTPAPLAEAEPLEPDWLIVPLLAFDRRGWRLGQGGGYYDRTLAVLRARGRVWAVGLAYAGQDIPDVPREAHDQRLDAILTETGYHAFVA
jgi:5-formyltetrahydrofolate cyclo-ligase